MSVVGVITRMIEREALSGPLRRSYKRLVSRRAGLSYSAGSLSAMTTAALVIGLIGLVLSAASITWQAATFVLSGGRVKVDLRLGAMHHTGAGMVHGPVSDQVSPEINARQGYTHPIIGVRVRSVGRLPVTVTEWSIFETHKGMSFNPIGSSIGPTLPYRMEAGSSEVWTVDAESIRGLIEVCAEHYDIPLSQIAVKGRVTLGDGRTYETADSLRGG